MIVLLKEKCIIKGGTTCIIYTICDLKLCFLFLLYIFFYQYVCALAIEPTTFCSANVLMQCSNTEPQEHNSTTASSSSRTTSGSSMFIEIIYIYIFLFIFIFLFFFLFFFL